MASPKKRRRKKMNGGYDKTNKPAPAPAAESVVEVTPVAPKPRKKRKSLFNKDK